MVICKCEGGEEKARAPSSHCLGSLDACRIPPREKTRRYRVGVGKCVSDAQLHVKLDVKLREIVLLLRLEREVAMQSLRVQV